MERARNGNPCGCHEVKHKAGQTIKWITVIAFQKIKLSINSNSLMCQWQKWTDKLMNFKFGMERK